MQGEQAVVASADRALLGSVGRALAGQGLKVVSVETTDAAREALCERAASVLVIDAALAGAGLDALLEEFRRLWPNGTAVIVGLDPEEVAIPSAASEAEVVPRSASAAWLSHVAGRAVNRTRRLNELAHLRERSRRERGSPLLVGRSPVVERLRRSLEALASGEGSILFIGEVGVGKGLAARVVHDQSMRAEGPFRVLRCSTLENAELRRDLLGEQGALDSVASGVLYLDEVGAMPPSVQLELAARLQSVSAAARVRVLCGSTMDLHRATEEGRFRDELLRHVAGATVRIEPLRARPEDVPLLARYVVNGNCEINELPSIDFAQDTLEAMQSYRWPGNVLELRNAVEHAAILALNGVVRMRDLPERVRGELTEAEASVGAGPAAPFRDAKRRVVDSFERKYLEGLMARHRGNVTSASQHAGMLRSALQRLLRKHSLKSSAFRKGP